MGIITRIPPHSIEAETSLLGACMLSEQICSEAISTLTSKEFFDRRHQIIFQTMEQLARDGRTIDLVVVSNTLQGQYDQIGGASYISSLTGVIPAPPFAKNWIKIISDTAKARRVIEMANNVVTAAYSGHDIEQVLDRFGQMFIMQHNSSNQAQSASQVADLTLASIKGRIGSKTHLQGITTGFLKLDRMTCGMSPSDLIILAARPSVGKTALALNIAINAAMAGHRVLVYSLEMSGKQLVERAISSLAGVPLDAIRSGDLDKRQSELIEKIIATIKLLPLEIDDSAGLSIGQIRARVKARSINSRVDLVVVDYLQLMNAKGEQNREREVAVISAGLKGLAKDLNIPVLALSQLNRGLENRADPTPRLSDLRDSGAIEQDADVVLMLHRNKDARPEARLYGKAELIIAKHRNGPTGSLFLKFEGQFSRFSDT